MFKTAENFRQLYYTLASVWLISRKAVRENPVLNLKTE